MQTRFFLPALALTWFAFTGPGPLAAQDDGLHWFTDYKEAISEARRSQKPILLEFRCEA